MRASTLVEAEARMANLRLSGFRAVRITSYWRPGLDDARATTSSRVLRNVGDAGMRNGVRVYVTVMSPGSAHDAAHRRGAADFASYAAAIVRGAPSIEHVIVGNEPNLNRFWLPQFGLDGSSAAPAAYLALLARDVRRGQGRVARRRRSTAAPSPRAAATGPAGRARRTRRRGSSRSSAPPTARAGAIAP